MTSPPGGIRWIEEATSTLRRLKVTAGRGPRYVEGGRRQLPTGLASSDLQGTLKRRRP
jgi:hypothetical protein